MPEKKDPRWPWMVFDKDKPHTEGEPTVREPGEYGMSPTKAGLNRVDVSLTKPNQLKRGEK